jgi:hypothetical protein
VDVGEDGLERRGPVGRGELLKGNAGHEPPSI